MELSAMPMIVVRNMPERIPDSQKPRDYATELLVRAAQLRDTLARLLEQVKKLIKQTQLLGIELEKKRSAKRPGANGR
jgi:hypothetical protein